MNHETAHPIILAATQLAAGGRYVAATSLLDSLGEENLPPEAHLLRGKICAQQGLYVPAIQQWQNIPEGDVRYGEAQAAIARANRLKGREGKIMPGRVLLLYFFLFIFLIGLIGITAFMVGRSSSTETPAEISVPREITSRLDTQSRHIQMMDAKLQQFMERYLLPPAISIDLPGITSSVEGPAVKLTFEDGLFQGGTARLTPEAVSLLVSLGRELSPYVGKVLVRVTGHTDNTPIPAWSQFHDNESLGLQRAARVIEHLRQSAQLPASMFLATSVGEAAAPHPNDSRENREKNRTVVIRLFTPVQ